jgi:hypothetical protein
MDKYKTADPRQEQGAIFNVKDRFYVALFGVTETIKIVHLYLNARKSQVLEEKKNGVDKLLKPQQSENEEKKGSRIAGIHII